MDYFDQYRTKWGFVSDKPRGARDYAKMGGNDPLWTALAAYAQGEHDGGLEAEDVNQLHTLFGSLEMADGDGPLGVFMRTPDNKFGQESKDNLTALAYVCAVGEIGYLADRWVEHGKSHLYIFNTEHEDPGKFTWSAWMLRFPALIASMKLASNKYTPNQFERVAWYVTQWDALRTMRRKKNFEAAIEGVLRNELALHIGEEPFFGWAREWDELFYRKFPKGLTEILPNWGKHWESHEIVRLLRES